METNNELKEKIERMKLKAEVFLKNNSKVFLVDIKDTYYFCYILFVGEDYIHIQHFKGNYIYGKERIYWADIIRLEEYQPRESEVSNEVV